MNSEQKIKATIPEEIVIDKIYIMRGQRVMFDRDLANPGMISLLY